jgi:phosphatidylinositol 4-kinase type 2
MALRRVFALDSDFKESMFARQIAVMKGQAWNVVETLKQEGHGPLELTRCTRICVWDDLVDVPVAIPMRVPSTDMSRNRARLDKPQQEEMDIGASYASAPPRQPQFDLLGSPTTELPNPHRFDLTREDSAADLAHVPPMAESDGLSTTPGYDSSDYAREAHGSLGQHSSATLPARPSAKGRTRFSFEFPRRADIPSGSSSYKDRTRRQRSLSTRSAFAGANGGKKGAVPSIVYEGDDFDEGDLGYAAASDMESTHKRKVIVERLETVKSKKPFFTWC